MLCRLRRWLPDRELVVVGDRTYATLRLLAACQGLTPPVTFLTRLRPDAVLHDPPPPRCPSQRGHSRQVSARQPSLLGLCFGHGPLIPPGQPTVPLRWVPQMKCGFQHLFKPTGILCIRSGYFTWERAEPRYHSPPGSPSLIAISQMQPVCSVRTPSYQQAKNNRPRRRANLLLLRQSPIDRPKPNLTKFTASCSRMPLQRWHRLNHTPKPLPNSNQHQRKRNST